MEGPHYLQAGFCPQFSSSDLPNMTPADSFVVDDLLDFPNDVDDPLLPDPPHSLPTDSNSALTPLHSSNSSSFSGSDPTFLRNVDLCVPVPYDDLAELEWLSNVVEESFSSEDLQKLQLITGMKARNDVEASETHEFHAETNQNVNDNNNNINNNNNNSSNSSNNSPIFNSEVSVPAKARSKRSRGSPCNWTSRLLLLSPTPSPSPASSSSEPDVVLPAAPANPGKKPGKTAPRKKDGGDGTGGEGRRCLHCSTDKTPQWRTGPLGPKTLCNACGVRYKSGRLVPEYRPAASPTFVLTKHSNSHRKVMELRRQKEMLIRGQQPHQNQQQPHQNQFLQHPNMLFDFDVPNGDDYLIHQHVGPDFRQLI